LWLDRNIRKATLVRSATIDDAFTDFRDQKLEALAGLRARLITDIKSLPGARILDGRFMTVQQAIGTPKARSDAVGYLTRFVDAARASGFVAELIAKHGVEGLSVA
jgi:polar amino acid transport system substrate-binding protein